VAVCARCGTESPSRAKFCLECGAPLAPAEAAPERRLVTALFCDLVGSTELGERLDPETLRAVLNEYYGTMRGVVEAHGGGVEKFIGDAVVGVFGLPAMHDDDALRAARAALEMQAAIPELNERLRPYSASLEVRIGLQSGEVVAGDRGSLVGGDTFNSAARLQSAAGPGEILVGDACARLLRGVARLEPVPPLRLAGKAEPVAAERLVAADARRPVRAATRLIGRERALDGLSRAFEDAAADRACVLATVLGPGGIGKTRLALELAERLRGAASVLVGHTPAYGEGLTYAPVIELLHAAAGVTDGGADAVARALRGRLEGMNDGAAVADRLADLLGVRSEAAAGEVPWAVRRLLEHLAAERPLVVVLDDVHLADAALLELVDTLADRLRGPILLLCLARPELLEQRPAWAGGKARAVTISLHALDDDATRELAGLLLEEADGELAARVASAAEGNPLYVEQYVAMLEEGGSAETLSVPPGIQALLRARVDRLAREDADLLSTAALEGREFSTSTLVALSGASRPATVRAALEGLERRDLVRRADETGERWAFAHGLLRDAAEGRLPKQARAALHAQLADLAASEGDAADELVGLHFERAAELRAELGRHDEETERLRGLAGQHLAAAGSRAFARLDLLATVALLGRAAELLPPSSPRRLELLPDLGVALAETGRPEEAVHLLDGAMAEAAAAGLDAARLRANVQLLSARLFLDPTAAELADARDEARRILAALAASGDPAGLAEACVLVEYLGWMQGLDGTEACLNAMEHARVAGRLRERLQAAGDLPLYLHLGPATPEATEAIARRLGGVPEAIEAATALRLYAIAAALRGDLDAFCGLDAAADELLATRGLEFVRAAHAETAAQALIDLGCTAEAERRLRDGVARMREIGDVWWEFDLETERAWALVSQGDARGAGAVIEALEPLEAPLATWAEITRRLVRARILLERDEPDAAAEPARRALALSDGSDIVLRRGDALETLAAVEQRRGREAEARDFLDQALALYERKGAVLRSERVRAQLGGARAQPATSSGVSSSSPESTTSASESASGGGG
jgi:class 3 adenylate cyclase/tetratricopeptide (TPR) repeat protein